MCPAEPMRVDSLSCAILFFARLLFRYSIHGPKVYPVTLPGASSGLILRFLGNFSGVPRGRSQYGVPQPLRAHRFGGCGRRDGHLWPQRAQVYIGSVMVAGLLMRLRIDFQGSSNCSR